MLTLCKHMMFSMTELNKISFRVSLSCLSTATSYRTMEGRTINLKIDVDVENEVREVITEHWVVLCTVCSVMVETGDPGQDWLEEEQERAF